MGVKWAGRGHAGTLAWLVAGLGGAEDLSLLTSATVAADSTTYRSAKEQVGEDFGKKPGQASPDDIWDWVTATRNASKWDCVRELAPL